MHIHTSVPVKDLQVGKVQRSLIKELSLPRVQKKYETTLKKLIHQCNYLCIEYLATIKMKLYGGASYCDSMQGATKIG